LVGSTTTGVAIDSQGRIVLLGPSGSGPQITRLDSSGNLDPTFNKIGAFHDPSGIYGVSSIVVQPDNSILLAGAAGSGSKADFEVDRIYEFGATDPTFGTKGVATVQFHQAPISSALPGHATSMVVTPDGKLVVAGYAVPDNATVTNDFAVARLLLDSGPATAPSPVGPGPVLPPVVTPSQPPTPTPPSSPSRAPFPIGLTSIAGVLTPVPLPPWAPPVPSTSPRITRVNEVLGRGGRGTILIRLSQSIRARASLPTSLFSVKSLGPDGVFGTPDDKPVRISRASYNARTRTISLSLAGTQAMPAVLQLSVSTTHIVNAQGIALVSNGAGPIAASYVVILGPG
jgi:uncharacterized delta-60 repeat protein